jgi:hypothetical protein
MQSARLLAALLAVGLEIAAGEPLGSGMQLPAITLPDQHGAVASVGPEVRLLIFAGDMDGAGIVEQALAENGAAVLASASAVFVSDIHRMPGMVTRLFALPGMRKRPYRILLDREGDTTAALPLQKGKVTLLRLDKLKIESIEYVDSATQLRAVLVAAKPQAAEQP